MAATVVLLLVAVSALLSMTNNDAATRTSLEIQALPCTDLEPLWLQAQAVPSASLIPCVRELPLGWSIGNVAVNDGRTVITLHHDRAGQAMEVRLTAACHTGQATELAAAGQAGVRRYQRVERQAPAYRAVRYEVFPGGCVTNRITAPPAHQAEITAGSAAILGYTARDELRRALEERSGGRLHLDP
jgi:hypothetical protein